MMSKMLYAYTLLRHRPHARSAMPNLHASCRFSSTMEDSNGNSNRQRFKEVPVHPSILSYIRKIGVGIPPRNRKRTRTSGSSLNQWEQTTPRLPRDSRRGRPQARFPASSGDKLTAVPLPFGPGSRVRVIATCTESQHFPQNPNKIPEVAVAGRSNVGKSTLLNALLYGNKNRPGLSKGEKATMSRRPGETREITFYQLSSSKGQQQSTTAHPSSSKLRLVDLPGYGFAYASPDQAAVFQSLMKEYILHRGKCLKRVLLLLDARHGLKKTDTDFLSLLQADGIELPPIQLVLTKCDLVIQNDLARRVSMVRQQLSDCLRREPSQLPVLLVSARTCLMSTTRGNAPSPSHPRDGLLELQKELAALVANRRGSQRLKSS